jgi:signal transduction histidine kinase
VSSRLAEGFHEIRIEDNGNGFDPSSAEAAGGSHIGIRNVRERVEKLCSGTLTLESRIGEGTTVTIRIPERKAAE